MPNKNNERYHSVDDLSLKMSGTAYIIQFDEKSGGFYLCDGHGFIMNHEDLNTLVKGINNFIEHYDKNSIAEYNESNFQDIHKVSERKQDERRNSELQQFIESYNTTTHELNQNELNNYFKDLTTIDKDYINTKGLSYPLVLIFYKENNVIYITKVLKELDATLARHKKNKDFDRYSIIHVDENYLEDVYLEAIIKYNPGNMTGYSITMKNSMYRSLNQIKKRYKEDAKVDLRVIKKIIQIYDMPIFTLNNGIQLVKKAEFEKAFQTYFHR